MRIRFIDFAAISIAALFLFVACQHRSSLPVAPQSNAGSLQAVQDFVPASIVHTGRFTEYTLPAHSNPTYLTNGPSNTVWFTWCGYRTVIPIVSSLSASTGAVHSFGPNNMIRLASCAIANVSGRFWFPTIGFEMQENWLVGVTSTGNFTGIPLAFLDFNSSLRNLVPRSDGRIWYPYCNDGGPACSPRVGSVSPTTATFGPDVALAYQPGFATQGPDTNLYITGIAVPYPTPNPAAAVTVVSTTGTIVHTFHLPNNSAPSGDATGPDGKIWIAETGLNKIARMTTTGALTHFSIPTANAGVFRITPAADGALWFTEANADKIGRITTSGVVTEYRVPTANSHPIGIIPCPTTVCGLHGGVWFTETLANKIGRYDFP